MSSAKYGSAMFQCLESSHLFKFLVQLDTELLSRRTVAVDPYVLVNRKPCFANYPAKESPQTLEPIRSAMKTVGSDIARCVLAAYISVPIDERGLVTACAQYERLSGAAYQSLGIRRSSSSNIIQTVLWNPGTFSVHRMEVFGYDVLDNELVMPCR